MRSIYSLLPFLHASTNNEAPVRYAHLDPHPIIWSGGTAKGPAIEERVASSHIHHVALRGLYASTSSGFLETQRLVRRLYLIDLPVDNSTAYWSATSSNLTTASGNLTAVSKAASANGINFVFGQSQPDTRQTGQSQSPGTQRVIPAPQQVNADLRTISGATYTTLLRYAKFSSACYVAACASPNGALLIQRFGQSGHTQKALAAGYIAQDDDNRELIVAFRGDPFMHGVSYIGKSDQRNSLVQATTAMPMVNLKAPTDAAINKDILAALIQGYAELDQLLQAAIANKKGYGITFTGHGVGGCYALLSAVAFRTSLSADVAMQIITYGAPRTGDVAFASYVDTLFQPNGQARYLRVTHGSDGMPSILNRQSGYEHAGVEIFQSNETIGGTGVFQCSGHEDRRCSGASDGVALGAPYQATSTATSPSDLDDPDPLVAAPAPAPATTLSPPLLPMSPAVIPSPVTVSDTDKPSFKDPARPGLQSCRTCLGTECIDCYDDSDDTDLDGRQAYVPGQPLPMSRASLAAADSRSPGTSDFFSLLRLLSNSSGSSENRIKMPHTVSKIPVTGSKDKRAQELLSAAVKADTKLTNLTIKADSKDLLNATVKADTKLSNLTIKAGSCTVCDANPSPDDPNSSTYANQDHQIILGVRFFADGINFCSAISTANTAAPKQDARVLVSKAANKGVSISVLILLVGMLSL